MSDPRLLPTESPPRSCPSSPEVFDFSTSSERHTQSVLIQFRLCLRPSGPVSSPATDFYPSPMKVYYATPTSEFPDPSLVVRLSAVVSHMIGRPSSSYAGSPRRARPFDVDHYRASRKSNLFLDANRFFACLIPGPIGTHVQLPNNRTCQTAVGA